MKNMPVRWTNVLLTVQMTWKFLKSDEEICLKDKERYMKVRAAYQEYDTELIEAQQKQQEIYNNAIPKVVTHQQNAYKVIKNSLCKKKN